MCKVTHNSRPMRLNRVQKVLWVVIVTMGVQAVHSQYQESYWGSSERVLPASNAQKLSTNTRGRYRVPDITLASTKQNTTENHKELYERARKSKLDLQLWELLAVAHAVTQSPPKGTTEVAWRRTAPPSPATDETTADVGISTVMMVDSASNQANTDTTTMGETMDRPVSEVDTGNQATESGSSSAGTPVAPSAAPSNPTTEEIPTEGLGISATGISTPSDDPSAHISAITATPDTQVSTVVADTAQPESMISTPLTGIADGNAVIPELVTEIDFDAEIYVTTTTQSPPSELEQNQPLAGTSSTPTLEISADSLSASTTSNGQSPAVPENANPTTPQFEPIHSSTTPTTEVTITSADISNEPTATLVPVPEYPSTTLTSGASASHDTSTTPWPSTDPEADLTATPPAVAIDAMAQPSTDTTPNSSSLLPMTTLNYSEEAETTHSQLEDAATPPLSVTNVPNTSSTEMAATTQMPGNQEFTQPQIIPTDGNQPSVTTVSGLSTEVEQTFATDTAPAVTQIGVTTVTDMEQVVASTGPEGGAPSLEDLDSQIGTGTGTMSAGTEATPMAISIGGNDVQETTTGTNANPATSTAGNGGGSPDNHDVIESTSVATTTTIIVGDDGDVMVGNGLASTEVNVVASTSMPLVVSTTQGESVPATTSAVSGLTPTMGTAEMGLEEQPVPQVTTVGNLPDATTSTSSAIPVNGQGESGTVPPNTLATNGGVGFPEGTTESFVELSTEEPLASIVGSTGLPSPVPSTEISVITTVAEEMASTLLVTSPGSITLGGSGETEVSLMSTTPAGTLLSSETPFTSTPGSDAGTNSPATSPELANLSGLGETEVSVTSTTPAVTLSSSETAFVSTSLPDTEGSANPAVTSPASTNLTVSGESEESQMSTTPAGSLSSSETSFVSTSGSDVGTNPPVSSSESANSSPSGETDVSLTGTTPVGTVSSSETPFTSTPGSDIGTVPPITSTELANLSVSGETEVPLTGTTPVGTLLSSETPFTSTPGSDAGTNPPATSPESTNLSGSGETEVLLMSTTPAGSLSSSETSIMSTPGNDAGTIPPGTSTESANLSGSGETELSPISTTPAGIVSSSEPSFVGTLLPDSEASTNPPVSSPESANSSGSESPDSTLLPSEPSSTPFSHSEDGTSQPVTTTSAGITDPGTTLSSLASTSGSTSQTDYGMLDTAGTTQSPAATSTEELTTLESSTEALIPTTSESTTASGESGSLDNQGTSTGTEISSSTTNIPQMTTLTQESSPVATSSVYESTTIFSEMGGQTTPGLLISTEASHPASTTVVDLQVSSTDSATDSGTGPTENPTSITAEGETTTTVHSTTLGGVAVPESLSSTTTADFNPTTTPSNSFIEITTQYQTTMAEVSSTTAQTLAEDGTTPNSAGATESSLPPSSTSVEAEDILSSSTTVESLVPTENSALTTPLTESSTTPEIPPSSESSSDMGTVSSTVIELTSQPTESVNNVTPSTETYENLDPGATTPKEMLAEFGTTSTPTGSQTTVEGIGSTTSSITSGTESSVTSGSEIPSTELQTSTEPPTSPSSEVSTETSATTGNTNTEVTPASLPLTTVKEDNEYFTTTEYLPDDPSQTITPASQISSAESEMTPVTTFSSEFPSTTMEGVPVSSTNPPAVTTADSQYLYTSTEYFPEDSSQTASVPSGTDTSPTQTPPSQTFSTESETGPTQTPETPTISTTEEPVSTISSVPPTTYSQYQYSTTEYFPYDSSTESETIPSLASSSETPSVTMSTEMVPTNPSSVATEDSQYSTTEYFPDNSSIQAGTDSLQSASTTTVPSTESQTSSGVTTTETLVTEGEDVVPGSTIPPIVPDSMNNQYSTTEYVPEDSSVSTGLPTSEVFPQSTTTSAESLTTPSSGSNPEPSAVTGDNLAVTDSSPVTQSPALTTTEEIQNQYSSTEFVTVTLGESETTLTFFTSSEIPSTVPGVTDMSPVSTNSTITTVEEIQSQYTTTEFDNSMTTESNTLSTLSNSDIPPTSTVLIGTDPFLVSETPPTTPSGEVQTQYSTTEYVSEEMENHTDDPNNPDSSSSFPDIDELIPDPTVSYEEIPVTEQPDTDSLYSTTPFDVDSLLTNPPEWGAEGPVAGPDGLPVLLGSQLGIISSLWGSPVVPVLAGAAIPALFGISQAAPAPVPDPIPPPVASNVFQPEIVPVQAAEEPLIPQVGFVGQLQASLRQLFVQYGIFGFLFLWPLVFLSQVISSATGGRSFTYQRDYLADLVLDLSDAHLDEPLNLLKTLAQIFPEQFEPPPSPDTPYLNDFLFNLFPEQLNPVVFARGYKLPVLLSLAFPEKVGSLSDEDWQTINDLQTVPDNPPMNTAEILADFANSIVTYAMKRERQARGLISRFEETIFDKDE